MTAFEGLLELIGALGLFLYAIFKFGDGVQKIGGEKIRGVWERQAKKPFSCLSRGIGVAAALQSNFLTFGMISSMVNAGLLGLLPAIWMMLGSNLGMTITTLLMALDFRVVSLAFLFFGYLFNFHSKNRSWHYLGQILLNLGLMYLGFNMFHHAFQLLGEDHTASLLIKGIMEKPWIGFLFGLSMAALLRSSNTVVVLTQAMVGVVFGLSNYSFLSGAVAIIIGSNVGTTIINMLVGMDRLSTVKKANWLHFSFNLSTGLLWLVLLPTAINLVYITCEQFQSSFQWFQAAVFQWTPDYPGFNRWFDIGLLALAHIFFNLTVICGWFPVTIIASKLGISLFTDKGKMGTDDKTFLDRRALQSPALALTLATHEINQMASICQQMLKSSRLAFVKGQVHLLNAIERDEPIIDDLQEQITFYLSALLSQSSLTESQSHRLAGLLHIVSDIERVGDHAQNIARLAEKRYHDPLPFSELALNEIELLFGKAVDVYNKACQSLRENNLDLAKQIQNREENIDKLEEELQQNHIHRLNQGKCWPGSGVIYVEMLSNLKRVAAHSANIAIAILEEGEI